MKKDIGFNIDNSLIILQITFAILSFIGSIASVIALKGTIVNVNSIWWFAIPILTIIFFISFFVIKAKRKYQTNLKLITDNLHVLNHLLRDKLHVLNKQDASNFTKQQLMDELQSTCKEIVVNLSNVLSTISGKDICVHIKHFPSDVNENINIIKDGTVKTLCCCNLTLANNKRQHIGNHPISANTHYQKVLASKFGHFMQDDFRKYVKVLNSSSGDGFETDIKNWEEFYGTVLMVPIRIMKDDTLNVLGILICDCEKANAFSKLEQNSILNMVKAYADACYTYFEKSTDAQKLLNIT